MSMFVNCNDFFVIVAVIFSLFLGEGRVGRGRLLCAMISMSHVLNCRLLLKNSFVTRHLLWNRLR